MSRFGGWMRRIGRALAPLVSAPLVSAPLVSAPLVSAPLVSAPLVLALEGSARAWSASCESAERFTLHNGVEVVLVAERSVPTVALVSSVHAGFRDDPPGYEGLAHFVEHLTFLGAPPFAPAFDLYQEIGATGVNATTSADTVDYFALVPSSQLERALWIEARRLGIGVHPLQDEQALAERRVLLREHALRNGYAPAFSLLRATYAALYPAEHPYHSPFPSVASIEQLTLGDARWFFSRFYRTDRTRLVLVGDLEPAAAKGWIEKHFGALDAPREAPEERRADGAAACAWAKKARTLQHRHIVQHTRAKNERLELFWPVAPDENPQTLRGLFSALQGELSEAMGVTGLSHQVHAELVELELGSFWALRIDVAPGQPFEKVEPLVVRVMETARSHFADEGDLTAKRQALELSEQLARERLMARALGLAERRCSEVPCVDAARYFTASGLGGQLNRFGLDGALRVERRHARGASEGGDLEVR